MIDLGRLITARDQAAALVVDEAVYAPIFERLDREVMARMKNDPVARARAIVGGAAAGSSLW